MKKLLWSISISFTLVQSVAASDKALTCQSRLSGQSSQKGTPVMVASIGAEYLGDCPLNLVLREKKERRSLRTRELKAIVEHQHVFRLMDYTFDQVFVRPEPEVIQTSCRYVTEEVYIEAITHGTHDKKSYLLCNPN